MTRLLTLSLRNSADCVDDVNISVHYLELGSAGEGRNVDQRVNQQVQLSLHHNKPVHRPHHC